MDYKADDLLKVIEEAEWNCDASVEDMAIALCRMWVENCAIKPGCESEVSPKFDSIICKLGDKLGVMSFLTVVESETEE